MVTACRGICMLVVCAALACLAAAAEQPAKAGVLSKLATERVVIFKDGHGLFIRSGTGVADGEGCVCTTEVPDAAVLGCVWAASNDSKSIGIRSDIRNETEVTARDSVCVSQAELLRANRGKQLRLDLATTGAVTGTIIDVLDLPPEPAVPRPDTPPGSDPRFYSASMVGPPSLPEDRRPGSSVRELVPRAGKLVAVKQADGTTLVLPVDEVKMINGEGLEVRMQRKEETTTRSKVLVFDLGKDAAGKNVGLRLIYFSEGMRWIPTYRLESDLKESSEMTMQAEVLNETEDIEHAAVDFVVGVPNFRFKNVVSPLSLERTMRTALAAAAPDLMSQSVSNVMINRSAEESASRGPNVMEAAPELAGEGPKDLYVYGVKELSLRKGARAMVPLLKSSVPLQHVYTLDVNLKRGAREETPRSGGEMMASMGRPGSRDVSPVRIAPYQVWHQLELTNTGKGPWTTGAALVVSGQLPVSQDTLTYASPGGKTLLPLTVAVDMRASQKEEETARQANALRWSGNDYSLVKKQGEITVTSNAKEKAPVRVRVTFGGKAETASDDAKIAVDDYRPDDWGDSNPGAINNHSEITWEITLEPGQSKTVTYTSSFYVR